MSSIFYITSLQLECILSVRMAERRHRSSLYRNKFILNGVWQRQSSMRFVFVFIIGVGVGLGLATLLRLPFDLGVLSAHSIHTASKYDDEMTTDSSNPPLIPLHHNMDLNSSFAEELLKGVQEISARKLAQEVRVLCWVMTQPKNHETKAFHVKATWGRHCNLLIFMSEEEDGNLPAVKLDVPSGRKGLWAKTVASFQYVYENFQDDYDWVLKADDDTYVIVENLRRMLLPYKSYEPHYFGFHFKPHTPMGYMSGGAGYVLSMEAVDLVVNGAFDGKNEKCPLSTNKRAEDVNIAKCLHAMGVQVDDSRDAKGRNRFLPLKIEHHMNVSARKSRWWFTDYRYWPMKQGMDCCSDETISFHYVDPTKMYLLEFLVYHVNAFPVLNLVTEEPFVESTTESLNSINDYSMLMTLLNETSASTSTTVTPSIVSFTSTSIPSNVNLTSTTSKPNILNNTATQIYTKKT